MSRIGARDRDTQGKGRRRSARPAGLLCVLALLLVLAGCGMDTGGGSAAADSALDISTAGEETDGAGDTGSAGDGSDAAEDTAIDREGSYTTKDDVALYIHTYGELPDNFITKSEAKALGWQGGGLEEVAPGKCIGGDYFGNYEGLLPEEYDYRECDIDTLGRGSRGAKRLVFADADHIYYTGDHYASFEEVYGK